MAETTTQLMSETHFVQAGDGPVLIGAGPGVLECSCGNVLIQGFDAARFLAIGIQCGRCSAVTATAGLADGQLPPRSAIVAAPSQQPATTAMTVPPDVSVVGQAEMERLSALFQPASPDNAYVVSDALLDAAATAFQLHVGAGLPWVGASGDPFDGLRQHPLAWAVQHLRARVGSAGSWACMEDAPTSDAVAHVTGFLHFVGTWSRHPLFPAMVATAGEHGFSLHGLALFAAAHCMAMGGNRISFPEPVGYPGRIDDFSLVTGPTDTVGVRVEVFDRFEYPFGRAWDHAALRAGVADVVAAAHARINPRHPGVLVLSPGAALAGFDEALIEAIKASVQAVGRKNRGLMAVAPVVLRLQALPDPHAVRFGYGFFPVANRHYRGENLVRIGA
jgi:hypothetical protein